MSLKQVLLVSAMSDPQTAMLNAINAVGSRDSARALEEARKVLTSQADNTQALFIAGRAAYELGRFDESVQLFGRLVAAEETPTAEGWYSLGLAHAAVDQHQKAFEAHRRALELDPTHGQALLNMGFYLSRFGHVDEAVHCFKLAISNRPTDPVAYHNAGNALKDFGMLASAMRYYQHALKLMPRMHQAMSNICYLHQFIPGINLARLRDIHAEWAKRYCPDPPPKMDVPDKDPDRRLRVGFISEDFRTHTVGRYLIGPFEHLGDDIDTYCYYTKSESAADAITERYKEAAHRFYHVHGKSDKELRDAVVGDQIDILFDLSGHTSGNQLALLAGRLAPVQVSWLGYVGTTGLTTMDYKLASEMSAPFGVDPFYSERILRFPADMPHQCYAPPDHVDIGDCPSDSTGYVTFGTISNMAKLNHPLLTLWAQLLLQVEGSRLLLKAAGFVSKTVRDGIAKVFEASGVETDRLLFEPYTDHAGALNTYNQIDIALDPLPFSGCTTTCEALWMGVPVITLPSDTEASRHSASFLNAVGLRDTITMNESDYIQTAASLASNPERRRRLRRDLRTMVLSSPMCDPMRFGEELRRLLRGAWHDYCRR